MTSFVAHLLVSYSSNDAAYAIAIHRLLTDRGWQHVTIEIPSKNSADRGVSWERALNEAGHYCEVVIFLVSHSWLMSENCRQQFRMADRLNKRLFVALIDDLLISELPRDITDVSDVFSISFTPDYRDFYITPPGAEKGTLVRFSVAGLRQLEHGLKLAGLEAKHFQWPPWDEPTRLSDRGIQPFEEGDAGIFFGREERIGSTLDLLRGFRKAAPPRLMIICGAQGVGKSSFLRAGLIPRLARDDGSFWIFPVIRPNQAALYGRSGLIASVRTAVSLSRIGSVPDEPHRALRSGSAAFRRLLNEVVGKRLSHVNAPRKAPMLVLCVDQAEELLTDEGRDEAKALMKLLRDLIIDDDPAVVAVLAIRSELYPRLQEAQLLNGIETTVVDLEPCAGHLLTHQHRTSG